MNLAPWRTCIRAHVPGVGVILSDDRARIHAALAWTFGLEPDAYAPSLEA